MSSKVALAKMEAMNFIYQIRFSIPISRQYLDTTTRTDRIVVVSKHQWDLEAGVQTLIFRSFIEIRRFKLIPFLKIKVPMYELM